MTKPIKWDRHSILGELRRRGMTLTKLAEMNDVSPGGFRTIWTRPNSNSEAIVANFLGIAVETLFPDRYPKRTARILSHEYTPESSKPHRDAA
ncbi:helix-turn-helix domain-containing protein [Pararhizobium sp.]|uniref:helix-turn-helix domain-containing protein n=1 Tax=Pararhizobium sp. TaxID=1977563 RepID=UPI003D09F121